MGLAEISKAQIYNKFKDSDSCLDSLKKGKKILENEPSIDNMANKRRKEKYK